MSRDKVGYYTSMGIALNNAGQYTKAISHFLLAILLYENANYESILCKAQYTSALSGLGNAYNYLGKRDKGMPYVKEALEKAEEGYAEYPKIFANIYILVIYNYCMTVCVPAGNYAKAEELAKKAIDIYNKKEVAIYDNIDNVYYMLAFLYQAQGKNKDAERMVDYGVRNFPDKPYFLDAKGELLMKSGKAKEAKAVWNKILSIDPNWAAYGSDFSKMILNQ